MKPSVPQPRRDTTYDGYESYASHPNATAAGYYPYSQSPHSNQGRSRMGLSFGIGGKWYSHRPVEVADGWREYSCCGDTGTLTNQTLVNHLRQEVARGMLPMGFSTMIATSANMPPITSSQAQNLNNAMKKCGYPHVGEWPIYRKVNRP